VIELLNCLDLEIGGARWLDKRADSRDKKGKRLLYDSVRSSYHLTQLAAAQLSRHET